MKEREKKKRAKDEVNGQGEKGGCPPPHTGQMCMKLHNVCINCSVLMSVI